MAQAYTIRALEAADLPMLKGWIVQPHWQEWWGAPDAEIEAIAAELDGDGFEPLIIALAGRPIAYAQAYDPHMEDGHPYQDQPFGTLGLDLSIADADMLHKGHGPAILEQLARLFFSEGAPRLLIDPHPANRAAVRAFAKAGFAALDERDTPFGRVLLMARDNPEHDDDA